MNPKGTVNGCGYDTQCSFAVWISQQTKMPAFVIMAKRHGIGNMQKSCLKQIKAGFFRLLLHDNGYFETVTPSA